MIGKIRSAVLFVFLFVQTALILDLANPLFGKPSRDGGFFLYAGSQILNGKIPYLDFWDSKGPAIFYMNAFGLWLGGGSRWGVWLVEFLFIFGTLSILYRVLTRRWGMGAALFGLTMAALGLHLALGYGNYTEEYALLFNAAGLFLFLSMVDAGLEKKHWEKFWVGVLFGLSFTFRANNIGGLFGILISIFLFELFKRGLVDALKIIVVVLAGFVLPFLGWTIYFALLGSAGEMIHGSLVFNFSYSAAKDRGWLDLFSGFGRYGMSWYGWVTLLAWGVVVLRAFNNFIKRKLSALEIFLVVWFPIEILVSNLSGRNFTHYYISWILAIAVYCAFIFSEVWQGIFKTSALQGWNNSLDAYIAAALAVGLLAAFPVTVTRYNETLSRLLDHAGALDYVDPVSDHIRQNTQPDDLLLTWYPEMGINFMAGRRSPVRYLYYPLFLEGSLTTEIESTYINELALDPPEVILDCATVVDAIPSLDSSTRKKQYSTPGVKRKMYIHPGMEQIFLFVSENYHVEKEIESCIIFRLN